jgi:hypothetical protein
MQTAGIRLAQSALDQPWAKRIKALNEVPITDMIEAGDG